jgi:ribulose kinase
MDAEDLFVGVDVGTGSARAALVTRQGQVLATASRDIKIWTPKPGYAEQSSQDIWNAVCQSTKVYTQMCYFLFPNFWSNIEEIYGNIIS